jgi:hypothetical protein
MEHISDQVALRKRDIFYQRQRTKNRFFTAIISFFAEEAQRGEITKREMSRRLSCDPSQITRWLGAPSNMTIEGISDILLSMGAEADVNVVRFADRAVQNEQHPLITAVASIQPSTSVAIQPPSGVTYQSYGGTYVNGTGIIGWSTGAVSPYQPTILGTTGVQSPVFTPVGGATWSSPHNNLPLAYHDFGIHNTETPMRTGT